MSFIFLSSELTNTKNGMQNTNGMTKMACNCCSAACMNNTSKTGYINVVCIIDRACMLISQFVWNSCMGSCGEQMVTVFYERNLNDERIY